ncbi:30S ribosomal protein S12 methylthiotransferase RimO [Myxococcota bacterium]|nr:30S ribosomal protein S12 methylthiotransferase RimO [Myxococcota bacterium]
MKARTAGLVHAVTLGCPRNRVDTEVMLGDLLSHGYGLTTSVRQADVVLVNTCGFLREAREESLEVLREMARGMRPGARLVAAGCMAQSFAREIRAAVPEVELLSGVRELLQLRGRLEGATRSARTVMPSSKNPRLVTSTPGSAYLKVSEGCNRRCSFCIIPRIRGRQRSRPLEDLAAETRALVASGIREIVLVAEDLSAWGRDLPGRPGLADLAEGIAREMPGDAWLRLMYVYPSGIEDRLLELLADHPVVLPYLDLPVQHADDGVLRAMRRGTRARDLRRLVERVRERVPGVVLRTTFLVGHPGEDGPAFDRLLEFARETAFEMAGAFAWSPEPGSHAAGLQGVVPQAERIRRKEVLEQVLAEAAWRSRSRFLGQVHEALVEEADEGIAAGRAWFQAPEVDGRIRIRGRRLPEGRQVPVRIRAIEGNDVEGEAEPGRARPGPRPDGKPGSRDRRGPGRRNPT